MFYFVLITSAGQLVNVTSLFGYAGKVELVLWLSAAASRRRQNELRVCFRLWSWLCVCAAGAVGLPLVLLVEDWDLCQSVRRTTDVLTLVTMFLWFLMLISYLIYYIRHNQAVARRHLDYLKFLESRDPFPPTWKTPQGPLEFQDSWHLSSDS